MEYLDARRLTGPNLLSSDAGSILDIRCSSDEADRLLPFCTKALRKMLDAVDWRDSEIHSKRLQGGVSIAFSARIDALYAASEISEWAWRACAAEFCDGDPVDFDADARALRQEIEEELNPPLLALEAAAHEHGVSMLWDDDEVSLGHGAGSETWPFRDLPDPAALDWSKYRDVPVGIVTGTNGKTTTARIAKHLLQSAGRNVGVSCTDWVAVNDRVVDRDDWSGPGGARMVLRQPDVDSAILETARGGLLRRGLGVQRADAALITNIAEDHLGDFGSQSLDELLNIKWVVSHAVRHSGRLVLNADDERLVAKAADYDGEIAWFSLDQTNETVVRHVDRGGVAFVLADGELVRLSGSDRVSICVASEMPISLGGAARHNVANALGAAALTERLGLAMHEIGSGLVSMSQDANPGRSNLYRVDGFSVLVDFAHNPEAMQALFAMAKALPARRRALCFAQAGDRTDSQIRDLAENAWSMGPDLYVVSELDKYRRGREEGEVYGIIRNELLSCGADPEQIRHYASERESFAAALDWAEAGDLVVILDLGRESGIQETLQALETRQ